MQVEQVHFKFLISVLKQLLLLLNSSRRLFYQQISHFFPLKTLIQTFYLVETIILFPAHHSWQIISSNAFYFRNHQTGASSYYHKQNQKHAYVSFHNPVAMDESVLPNKSPQHVLWVPRLSPAQGLHSFSHLLCLLIINHASPRITSIVTNNCDPMTPHPIGQRLLFLAKLLHTHSASTPYSSVPFSSLCSSFSSNFWSLIF